MLLEGRPVLSVDTGDLVRPTIDRWKELAMKNELFDDVLLPLWPFSVRLDSFDREQRHHVRRCGLNGADVGYCCCNVG
jgi:hypothetical protein